MRERLKRETKEWMLWGLKLQVYDALSRASYTSSLLRLHTKERLKRECYALRESPGSESAFSHVLSLKMHTRHASRLETVSCRLGAWCTSYADVCWRMLTYADVCWRMLTYTVECCRMLTSADVHLELDVHLRSHTLLAQGRRDHTLVAQGPIH